MATKKRYDNQFLPFSFVALFGSGIRAGMGKTQDPGSVINNIPDPQHWFYLEESLGGHDATDETTQLRPETQYS
jgi:hypothetical protein